MSRDRSRSRPAQAARLVAVAGALALVLVAVGRRIDGALDPASVATDARPVEAPAVATELSDPRVAPTLVGGPDRPADTPLPTGPAGTARTWYAQDRWWAVLPDPASGAHGIWSLAGPEGPWVDSGVVVDERPYAQLEVAWSGEWLVIAASGTTDYRSHGLRLHRFSWSREDGTWRAAADHPIAVTSAGAPGTRLAVTADGSAWLARADGRGVQVVATVGATPELGEWTGVPVEGSVDDVGAFDLVASGEVVRVVWRSLTDDAVVVARREGDTWGSAAVPVAGAAGEEPIDAATTPDGELLVLVPLVGQGTGGHDQAPALLVLAFDARAEIDPAVAPTTSVAARAGDRVRSPSLVLAGDRVHVLGIVSPSDRDVELALEAGVTATAAIVGKSAPLDALAFDPGPGRVLVGGVDGADPLRPLVPSGVVPEGGGLVVVATAEAATRWVTWSDGAPSPPVPGPEADAEGDVVLVNDTFEALPTGSPAPGIWRLDSVDTAAGVLLDDPVLGGRALVLDRGPGGDDDPASACRPVPEIDGARVTVEAVVHATGQGTADARLLTVRGPAGNLASVRLPRLGLVGWSTAEGRVTPGTLPDGTPVRVVVALDLGARTADVTVTTLGGDALARGADVPWLVDEASTVDEVCFRPAPGTGTGLGLDLVRVTIR